MSSQSSMGYDSLGRLTWTQDPDLGRIEYLEYDNNSKILRTKDPKGNIFTYKYDILGRMTKRVYPDNSMVEYYYDEYYKKALSLHENHNPYHQNLLNETM